MDKKENKKLADEQLGSVNGGYDMGTLYWVGCNTCGYSNGLDWFSTLDTVEWFKNYHTKQYPTHTSYTVTDMMHR